ncbi:MAG TPA: hypothetical protein VGQ83_30285 [Polyangia bacterium]|jgi:outer membrane protein assembly factor BamB
MLGIAFEVRGQCGACGGPLLLNALVPRIACPACGTPRELAPELWKSLLEDAVAEAPRLPLGEGGTQQMMLAAGTFSVLYGHQNPRCGACKTDVPLDDVGALVARGAARCTGCGETVALRVADGGLLGGLVDGTVLVVGEEPGLAAPAAAAAPAPERAAQPVAFACPQCAASLPVDGAARTVVCEYCRASVYLPDDLWHHLHPVKTAQRWYLWLDERQIRAAVSPMEALFATAQAADAGARAAEVNVEARVAARARTAAARKTSVLAVLIPVLLPILIIGGIFGGRWISTHTGRADGLDDAVVIAGARGPVLVGLEEVRGSKSRLHRLSFVDARKGTLRERLMLGRSTALVGAAGTVVWIYDADVGIAGYDGASGRLLVDQARILARNPVLRGRLMAGSGSERYYAIDTGRALVVKTNQGHSYRIATGSWAATRVATPELLDRRPDRFVSCWGVHIGDAYRRFDGEHRKRMVDGKGRVIAADRAAKEGFLEGTFTCRDTRDGSPLTLAKPESLVVVQKTSLDGRATDVLTRVTLDGRVLWSRPLGLSLRGGHGGILVSEGRLVVVGQVSYREHEAVALDARTGKVVWRYQY